MQTGAPSAHIGQSGLGRQVLAAASVLVLFVVDRLVKLWVVGAAQTNGPLLSFGYVPNTAGVFSLPFPRWLLLSAAALALVCLVAVARDCWHKGRLLRLTGVALMLVGGASNVLDRLQLGSVTDVFTTVGGLSFNLSDLYLVAGLVLLLLS